MTFVWLLIVFLVFSFLLSIIHLLAGLLLCRFRFSHRFGVKLLARSCLLPGKCIACYCHQNCESINCRNWNCENFHHSR